MSAVVLMYHRVAALPEDPFGLAVDPERFRRHVEHMAGLGCVVPLSEALAPSRAPRLAITFDDGYADNATTAVPLLEQAGLPATLFITTGRLGERRFWWDRLADGLLGAHALPDGVDVRAGGRALWLALNDEQARRATLHFLHRRLLPLPPAELADTVDGFLHELGVPPATSRTGAGITMSVRQLRHIDSLPGFDVGAHSRSHLRLQGQPAALQRDEVIGSVGDLAKLLDRPVRSFAYPFGGRNDVGELAPRLVREAECELACTTRTGAVPDRPDRYRLPRLNVRDWDAPAFAERVAAALGR